MVTACEKCLAKHEIDLSRVDKPAVKYRCVSCGHVNTVFTPGDDGSGHNALKPLDAPEPYVAEPETEVPLPDPPALPQLSKPKISGLSIRSKITIIIVALVVTSLSIVGFVATSRGSRALSGQAQTHLQLVTGQKAMAYNSIFSRLQNEIEGVAVYAEYTFARPAISGDLGFRLLMPWTGAGYGNPALNATLVAEGLALQRVGIFLEALVQRNPYLELGYMATENGVFVADSEDVIGVIEAEQGYQPKKRAWYMAAVEKKDTIWTPPYIDVNTKKLIVSCATPVYLDDQTLVGVVGFDVLLDTIRRDIITLDIGYDSSAFLLGQKGRFLAKPGMDSRNIAWNQAVKADSALATDNPAFKKIIKQMMAGQTGVGSYTESGAGILIAYAPLPAIEASVGIVVSESAVMAPAVRIQKIITGIWVGVVVISVIIGLIIGNGITKPINALAMRAELISQGQTDLEEISNRRTDEIGVLIESFNRLVTSLKIAMSRSRK
ncbi:MAG: cache domain-containing protein [Desulfobacter sp.]